LPKHDQAAPAQVAQAHARGVAWATAVQHGQEGGRAWRPPLAHVSRRLHPWRLVDSIRHTSQEVEAQWRAELQALEALRATHGLPMQPDTVDKGRPQRAGLAALGDCGWQPVRQALTHRAMTPRWTQGAADVLRPLMDGQAQRRRTRHAGQKAQIALVLQAVEEACARPPCTRQRTSAVLAAGKAWAADHARAFQRASSAVAGRHGSRSQRQHTHRGLPTRRSPGWTVVHTFDGQAADGTTPASRFCRRSCPTLFARVLSQIDALPMPRQRRQAIAASH